MTHIATINTGPLGPVPLALPPALACWSGRKRFAAFEITAKGEVPPPALRSGPMPPPPGEKANKRPVGLNGFWIATTDLDAWTNYEEAAAYATAMNMARGGHWFGVGRVFVEGEGDWFLDIDGAIDEAGRESPVLQYLRGLLPDAAYEISQSGRGAHFFGTGWIAPHACRNTANGLEFYTGGRFAALSGRPVAGDASVRPAGLDLVVAEYFPAVTTAGGSSRVESHILTDGPAAEWDGPTDDAELFRLARHSRQSAAVAFGARCPVNRLIEGDPAVLTEFFNGDRSALDAALAQHLAFWTGKHGTRIERLMRKTDWHREKWDRDDYLPRTIAKACAQQVEVYSQSRRSLNPVPVKGNTTFRLTDTGVEKKTEIEDKVTFEKKEVWNLFCSRLEVLADTRSHDGKNWGRLLRITDRDGTVKDWAMPMSLMAGEGAAYRESLYDLGFTLFSVKGAKNWLEEYLTTVQPDAKARCVTRIGWHNRAFVLPDATMGDTGGEVTVLQGAADHAFRVGGTLDGWRDGVARMAVGNSRLALAIAAGFAAPLLHLVDAESGGFHFRGASSTGKSTALIAAGSVWGGGGVRGYVRSWRTTDNALEAVALNHSDALLCLDELGQVAPPAAAAAAYMLSNGAGKSRATKTGDARPAAEWRTLFLSSGEISLSDKISEDGRGRKAAAGQQARLVDIAADAGVGLGLFEFIHGFPSADAFARAVKAAASEHFGHAARVFLERLTVDLDGAITGINTNRNAFTAAHCPPGSDGQVSRVAARFGLVAAAGELAASWGILPWPGGEATRAAAVCFRAWLDGRGGIGAAEDAAAISAVRRFIELHGASRFEVVPAAGSFGSSPEQRVLNRAGYKRLTVVDGSVEFWITPEVWKSEVCAGLDASAVAKTLLRHNYLIAKAGRLQAQRPVPGVSVQPHVYVVTSAILSGE